MFKIVTIILIDPMIEEAPIKCIAKIVMSMPGPICTDKGAYRVQPAAVAPPGARNEPNRSAAATGIIQKLKLFIRAKAISAAPICNGIIKLANPTKAGIMAPKTITKPCMVVN